MRGRNLVDPLEERAVPVQDGVQILVEALVVPARRDPRREERLRLGGEVERVAPARIVERLDAEAIPRREDEAVPLVPEHEGELTAQVAEAVGALLLVEVEKYLAVGARTQAVAAHDELALVASVVVELTVHDDVELLILVGDRLVAGGEVDDAEPRVPHAHPSVRRDPLSLPVGAAVVQRLGGAPERVGGDRAVAGEDRDDAAHGARRTVSLSSVSTTNSHPSRRPTRAHAPALGPRPRR